MAATFSRSRHEYQVENLRQFGLTVEINWQAGTRNPCDGPN
jgi:hypothetical protein